MLSAKEYLKEKLVIIGPCTLESLQQMTPICDLANKWQISHLRSPLFKPRTHPDSFQGLGANGIEITKSLIAKRFNTVIEVLSSEQLELVLPLSGILQIGARNMQNFELLKLVASRLKNASYGPKVMLKRGFQNTYEEWLASALYLERYGLTSDRIILCERGTRNICSPNEVTLDLAIALKAKFETKYQVIADPSHGTRDSKMVLPLASAIMALPLDGLMMEIHPIPKESVSDARQAISPIEFDQYFSSFTTPERHLTSSLSEPNPSPVLDRI